MRNFFRKSIILTILISIFITTMSLQGCTDLKTRESYLLGVVNDVEKQVAIGNVVVEIKNNNNNATYKAKTDMYGKYKISCDRGYYQLTATKNGYSVYAKRVTIVKGKNQEDFYLSQLTEKPCTLIGSVVDDITNKPLPNVSVQVGENLTKTDKSGNFKIEKLPIDRLNTWVTVPGYEALNTIVNLTRGKNSTTFRLKPLKISSTNNSDNLTRRVEYAVSPSNIEDYKGHSIRVIYPEKERHEYWIVSADRYTRSLKFDETIKKGEFVYIGTDVYTREDGKIWKKADPSMVMTSGDIPFQLDLEMVLPIFNFHDTDIDVTFIGTEEVNGYKTRKYSIISKQGIAIEKEINISVWLIDTPEDPKLDRIITKISGRTNMDNNKNWAVVDVNFTDIGKGNIVKRPV